MRKMKGSGSYLKNQVRKNLAKAALCLVLFGLIFFTISLHALYTFNLSIFEAAGLLISLVPLGVFYFYLRKYHIYSGGWEGEKRVAKLLGSKLNDDYILLNDLYLLGGGGDIDHVVLAPGCIFVLETKNWSGQISCSGDEWQRLGRGNFKGSPSRQVRRNASTIKRIIDSSPAFTSLNVCVESVVVFTNEHSNLRLNNPTVFVLRLPQLPNHIIECGSASKYSRQQLIEMGKEILKQKR